MASTVFLLRPSMASLRRRATRRDKGSARLPFRGRRLRRPLKGKRADPLSLRVARRRRDAIDGLSKNTVDAIYGLHGRCDAYYSIHPGAAANAVEFVEAQFANFIVEIGHVGLLSNKGPFPCFNRWSQGYAVSFIASVIRSTLQNRPLLFSN